MFYHGLQTVWLMEGIVGLLQRIFGKREAQTSTQDSWQAAAGNAAPQEPEQEECSPLRDLGKEYVELWFESVHGFSGDSSKPVHFGQQARYYPQESVVQIETWGSQGARGEEHAIPSEVTEKDDIIDYLDAHGVFVPFEYRMKRIRSDGGAR